MRIKLANLIGLIFVLLLLSPDLSARGRYRPGDWISYTVFRYVTSMALDFDHVYFGTTGGVLRYNRMHKTWEPPMTTSDGLLDNRVRRVAYDPDKDELWFDTRSGVCMYKPIFESWYPGGECPYNLVQSHKADTLLPVLFMDYGYHFFPEGYITDLYLNRYPVTDYFLDDWDDLWLGTWGLNAGMGSVRDLELRMFKFGLYDSDVNAICLDRGVIWAGGRGFYTPSEGITRFDQAKNLWEYFQADRINGLGTNRVNMIEADSAYVWFGLENGLARYEKKKKLWTTFTTFSGLRDEWVSALKADGEVLWVGTKSGLNFYWAKKDTLGYFRNELVDNVYIYSIETDSQWVWAGTEWGVARMNKSTGDWFRFSTPHGILNSQIRSITRNKDVLWFGTDSGILSYDLLTQKTKVYQAKVNFPGTEIRKILCDNENLWVATFQGVWKMELETEVWRLFNREDGLLDDNVQDMVIDGDHIWFGTPEGLTRFFWNNPYRID
jgi:ligand-binding sensor domain-containing protein